MTARLATDCAHGNNWIKCATCRDERIARDERRKKMHEAYALVLADLNGILAMAPDRAARDRMLAVEKFLQHRERLFQ